MGTFQQYGGDQTADTQLILQNGYVSREQWSAGRYELHGGTLAVNGMHVEGYYTQTGGSNYVSGDVSIEPILASGIGLKLTGGVLTENNLSCNQRAVYQSGGLHTVRNNLILYGSGTDWNRSYGYDLELAGGQLQAANIALRDAIMTISPGTLVQSGILTLGPGKLLPRSGNHEFGVLNLDTYYTIDRFHDCNADQCGMRDELRQQLECDLAKDPDSYSDELGRIAFRQGSAPNHFRNECPGHNPVTIGPDSVRKPAWFPRVFPGTCAGERRDCARPFAGPAAERTEDSTGMGRGFCVAESAKSRRPVYRSQHRHEPIFDRAGPSSPILPFAALMVVAYEYPGQRPGSTGHRSQVIA